MRNSLSKELPGASSGPGVTEDEAQEEEPLCVGCVGQENCLCEASGSVEKVAKVYTWDHTWALWALAHSN